jgi:hypothetical protein
MWAPAVQTRSSSIGAVQHNKDNNRKEKWQKTENESSEEIIGGSGSWEQCERTNG